MYAYGEILKEDSENGLNWDDYTDDDENDTDVCKSTFPRHPPHGLD